MDREQENLLILTSRILRFASEHPYAATGIFGAAVGSAVTYKVIMSNLGRSGMNRVFTPKMYQFMLTPEDLRRMMMDPTAEIRFETAEMTAIVTTEQREPIKALPDIEQ